MHCHRHESALFEPPSVEPPGSTARGCERDHELAAAWFDAAGDLEVRRQPAEPLNQPISGLIGVRAARATGYDFAPALTP